MGRSGSASGPADISGHRIVFFLQYHLESSVTSLRSLGGTGGGGGGAGEEKKSREVTPLPLLSVHKTDQNVADERVTIVFMPIFT